MIRLIFGLGVIALATLCIAEAQTRTRLSDFNVSDGKIEKAAGDRLLVNSKEMRATLKKTSPSQKVTLNFTYLGPTGEVSHLAVAKFATSLGSS